MEHERLLRALLEHLGVACGKRSTLNAITAVLAQRVWPGEVESDEESRWTRYGASRSNYHAYSKLLRSREEAAGGMASAADDASRADEGDSAHSTTMGTHNLNMMGNMPIAHTLRDAIEELATAIRDGADAQALAPLATRVATQTGQRVVKQATISGVIAACRYIHLREQYPTYHDAGVASGTYERHCRTWTDKLQSALRAEEEREAQQAERLAQRTLALVTDDASPYASEDATPGAGGSSQGDRHQTAADTAAAAALAMLGQPPSAPPSPPECDIDEGDIREWYSMVDESNGARNHSTTMGKHNLNMMGDMPVAHGKGGTDASPAPLVRPTPLGRPACAAPAQPRRNSAASASPPQLEALSRTAHAATGLRTMCATPPDAAARPQRQATKGSAPGVNPRSPSVQELAARRSPRLVRHEASTVEIDDAIELHASRMRAPSPQPATAAEARRMATKDIADRLVGHDSKYALSIDDPEALRDIVIDAADARDAGIPHGTATADEWGFAWVRRFAKATGNVWMRPRAVTTATDALCEIWFTILALVWIAQMMAPSARRRRAGYEQGKPTSALLAIYGHRRVMRDCGRYLPDLTQARGVLKGICARYKARWGDDAFVPQRKQPFTTAHLVAIVRALTSLSILVTWPNVLRRAVLTAFCYAMSTGARKDEWTLTFEGDTYARRANFTWVDAQGNDLPSSPEIIRSRRNGDMLRGRSSPSKCDRLNIEWGSRDMWFRYDDTNELNFPWRWQQWENAHPCPQGERQRWPAFSPSGNEVPFTGSAASACLNAVMGAVMTAAEAAQRTWHSARITVATRLFAKRGTVNGIARDEIEGVTQSIVRWKTPEAMRLYARMQPTQYADYVDMAANLHPTPGEATLDDIPEVDPSGVLAEAEATMAALDVEASRAVKAARTTRGEASADAGGDDKQRKRRRTAPVTGDTQHDTGEPVAPPEVFDIGSGTALQHIGDDSWGVVGQALRMHNSFWGWQDNEYSQCRVVGYAGTYTFPDGQTSKHTYVVECEGICYPARHTAVAGALIDPAVKRRVRRAPAPRVTRA
jgi:hypothetical protein